MYENVNTRDSLLHKRLFVVLPQMFSGTRGSVPVLCEVVKESMWETGPDNGQIGYKTLTVKTVPASVNESTKVWYVDVLLDTLIQLYDGD